MGQQYFPTPINHADSHWEKKEKPWKLTEEISFYHWLVPLVQQQQTHAAGAGSIAKWGAKAAASGAGSRQRSPGCQRPHAKNDSHPAKFSGSCVLTNWANLNQQNSVLAQGNCTECKGVLPTDAVLAARLLLRKYNCRRTPTKEKGHEIRLFTADCLKYTSELKARFSSHGTITYSPFHTRHIAIKMLTFKNQSIPVEKEAVPIDKKGEKLKRETGREWQDDQYQTFRLIYLINTFLGLKKKKGSQDCLKHKSTATAQKLCKGSDDTFD